MKKTLLLSLWARGRPPCSDCSGLKDKFDKLEDILNYIDGACQDVVNDPNATAEDVKNCRDHNAQSATEPGLPDDYAGLDDLYNEIKEKCGFKGSR